MVSDAALKRKAAFQEKKQQLGGVENLFKQNKNRKVRVHFTEKGEIVSISENTDTTLNGLFHADFTREQISIFEGKSISNFRIARDPDVDGLFYIEVRETLVQTLNVFDFLTEITDTETDPDINIVIDRMYFKVSISKKCLEYYRSLPHDRVTANGKTFLDFYLTLKGNPHFLIEHVRVKFSDLVAQHQITEVLDQKHTGQYSVYTKKALDKYRLTVL